MVAESTPQIRTIKVDRPHFKEGSGYKWEYFTFQLGFPYMQFYLQGQTLYLSFSKKPVQNLEEDDVSFPFLPNIYGGGLRVCLPLEDIFYTERGYKAVDEQTMEQAVERFWNSSFYVEIAWVGLWLVPDGIRKHDMDACGSRERSGKNKFCGQALEQFKAWEEGTRKEGVDFISNLDWPHTFKNLPFIWETKPFYKLLSPSMSETIRYCHRS